VPEEISVPEILRQFDSKEIDLVCVLGPTASGKTRYAVKLARELDSLRGRRCSEILSADSRQVYRGMDIGTGKDLAEYGDVPYHLIDIVDAGTRYDIYEYQKDFEEAYQGVLSRGGIPILCGGSGLYIEAATCGYALTNVPPDPALREELEGLDAETLKKRLLDLRPQTAEGTLQSKRRVIRALEIALYEESHPVQKSDSLPKKTYYIGTLVGREERITRIDKRLDERLGQGMVEETKRLLSQGIAPEDLVYYGLEYKFVTQHVMGVLSHEDMRQLLANAIHQFAKRQMTWFRGMERDGRKIHWVNP